MTFKNYYSFVWSSAF